MQARVVTIERAADGRPFASPRSIYVLAGNEVHLANGVKAPVRDRRRAVIRRRPSKAQNQQNSQADCDQIFGHGNRKIGRAQRSH